MTISKLTKLVLRRAALTAVILALAVLSDPSVRRNKQAGPILPDVQSLMAVYGADAVTIDRNARDFKLPAQFDWKGRPGSVTQSAILFGDPAKRCVR